MKQIVSEDFGDFLKEELHPEIGGLEPDDEIVDTSGMPDMEEDEVDIEDRKDKIRIVLRNELLVPEYARESLLFIMKSAEQFEAVPMAEFPSGNTFVVKYNGEKRKVKIEDITDVELAGENSINEDADADGYSFCDFLKDVEAYVKENVPDWEALIAEDGGTDSELIAWIERNQDLWNLKESFLNEVPAVDVADDITRDILQIEAKLEEDEE